MSIYVNVLNQKMYISSHFDDIVEGSQQFVKFKFNLSDDWAGLTVFAQFRQNGNAYNEYLDKENLVCLPAEIKAGTCTLMLYGTKDTTIGTTNYITFRVGRNNFVSDAQSTDISQSLYTQLVNRFNEIEERTEDQIYAAVKEEMSNYLNSGVLAHLALENGSVTYEKLSDDVGASLSKIDAQGDKIIELDSAYQTQSEIIKAMQDNVNNAVLTTAQSITEEGKLQARRNIGAIGDGEDVGGLNFISSLTTDEGINIDFHENVVHGVNTPETDTDAANKGYVDEAIGDIETAVDSIIEMQEEWLIPNGDEVSY